MLLELPLFLLFCNFENLFGGGGVSFVQVPGVVEMRYFLQYNEIDVILYCDEVSCDKYDLSCLHPRIHAKI